MKTKSFAALAALVLAAFGSTFAGPRAYGFQTEPPPEMKAAANAINTIMTDMRNQVLAVSAEERASHHFDEVPELEISLDRDISNTSNGVIHVAVVYVTRLQVLAMFVGHDIAVADGFETDVTEPQLNTAWETTQVLSQTDVADQLFGDEYEDTSLIGLSLRCNADASTCYQAQNVATLCGMFFFVGHEMAHNVLHHHDRAEGAYPVDEEMAADKLAATWLKRYMHASTDRAEIRASDESRNACLAMPAAFLELSARSAGNTDAQWFEQRKQAYLDSVVLDDSFVEALLDKQKLAGGLGWLTVKSDLPLESVIVDGVRVEPRAAIKLPIPAGTHSVVWFSKEGAGAKKLAVRQGVETTVTNNPHPFSPRPVNELEQMRAKRNWLEVLLGSSTPDLRPAQASLAPLQWEALHKLRLDDLIDVDEAPGASGKDIRRALRWKRSALPGGGWDEAGI